MTPREPLYVPPRPCVSCPYRLDHPPGTWDAEEYEKLPRYDHPPAEALDVAPFLCHQSNATGRPTACRGWLGCLGLDSVAVRLAVVLGLVTIEEAEAAELDPGAPLHPSSTAAAAAGLAGVEEPGPAASAMVRKLIRARAGYVEPVPDRPGRGR